MRLSALWLALLGSAALARKAPARGPQLDPQRFFALRPGLVRIYEGRAGAGSDDPPAGASCEVLQAKPRDGQTPGSMTESCTMIVDRKAKPATELSYELREDGIFNVAVKVAGSPSPQALNRLVLPAPLRPGVRWTEPRGSAELVRTVTSAGSGCKAAGRSFADCLVLEVRQNQRGKVLRRYGEIYAAGVGLVEDAQWQLIDVKGL